jgi:hypothetical protein
VNLNEAMRVRLSGACSAALILVLLGLTSCGGSDVGTEPQTLRAASISLSPNTASLSFIGATATLTVKILDQNGDPFAGSVIWSSDDPLIFSVTNTGTVTAVSNGSATVRAVLGSLSATATVTVQQVAASVAIVSGSEQVAFAGETLADPVVVLVKDQGGAAVAGAPVTFTADGGGSANPGSVTSDANGEASTSWTLGEPLGPQALSASITGGASATLTATSLSLTPLPDLVTGGTLDLSRSDPSSLEAVEVEVTVQNDGNAGTGGAFRVQLLADGAEIATTDLAALAPGESETVTFNVGPFAPGAHTLRLNTDADDAIEEGNEANNGIDRSLQVVLQTDVESGSPLAALSGSTDDELLFRIEVPAGSPSNLTVELSGGSGDVDLFIERGERPSNRTDYNDCLSTSPTTNERCQISPINPGTYHILLHAFSPFSGTTMTVTLGGEVLPFDIEIVFIDHGTATQDSAIMAAAERWMSIMSVDIPDSDFSTHPLPANRCIEGQPVISDNVDDLRIYVSIVEIDGVSGTLASAGPCSLRGITNFPIVGSMKLDSADLNRLEADGDMSSVVLHEMGHILGIGTIWCSDTPCAADDPLQNPSLPSSSGADTHFTGPLAIAAFDAAGGSAYTGGAKVPVANLAKEGSSDSHWRELVLDNELMTPIFDGGRENPLSAISIQSLADLGYSVDVDQAETYSRAFSAPARAPTKDHPIVDLSGDVRRGPIVVVDGKGRVIRVRN